MSWQRLLFWMALPFALGSTIGLGVALVTAGDSTVDGSDPAPAPLPTAAGGDNDDDQGEPIEIDWLAMMPPEEVEALRNAPPVDHFGFGLVEQAQSYATVPAMNGKRGKLAGYVVPIKTSDDGRLLEFFLVPYFGACFHVPPPPPNQIVYARLQQPVFVPEMYEPQWAIGTLRTERHDISMAASAYAMDVQQLVPWTE